MSDDSTSFDDGSFFNGLMFLIALYIFCVLMANSIEIGSLWNRHDTAAVINVHIGWIRGLMIANAIGTVVCFALVVYFGYRMFVGRTKTKEFYGRLNARWNNRDRYDYKFINEGGVLGISRQKRVVMAQRADTGEVVPVVDSGASYNDEDPDPTLPSRLPLTPSLRQSLSPYGNMLGRYRRETDGQLFDCNEVP